MDLICKSLNMITLMEPHIVQLRVKKLVVKISYKKLIKFYYIKQDQSVFQTFRSFILVMESWTR